MRDVTEALLADFVEVELRHWRAGQYLQTRLSSWDWKCTRVPEERWFPRTLDVENNVNYIFRVQHGCFGLRSTHSSGPDFVIGFPCSHKEFRYIVLQRCQCCRFVGQGVPEQMS